MNPDPSSINTIDKFTELISNWYSSDYEGFKTKFDKAVANVKSIPEGTPPPVIQKWANAGIEELCSFFQAWHAWNPNLESGLQYIVKFSWLYYQNQAGIVFITTAPGNLMAYYFVELTRLKMDSPASRVLVKQWMQELGKEMDEYIIPQGGYKSFNEFFARELKPGKRGISAKNDDSVVVSPADAYVVMIDDDLTLEKPLDVKTQKLSVLKLLNYSSFAKHFVGGTAVSCFLAPNVYHRYHAPVTGTIVESVEDVTGNYFGIEDFPKLFHGGDIGYSYDFSVFENFRRGYMVIETKKYGYVAFVPVGLNTIGSVVFHKKFKSIVSPKKLQIAKGEEIGYFQYGGSLNILLFERGRFPSIRIPQGQMIGTLNERRTSPP